MVSVMTEPTRKPDQPREEEPGREGVSTAWWWLFLGALCLTGLIWVGLTQLPYSKAPAYGPESSPANFQAPPGSTMLAVPSEAAPGRFIPATQPATQGSQP
jgi:hypothetical protein